jgi:hypothetical protein
MLGRDMPLVKVLGSEQHFVSLTVANTKSAWNRIARTFYLKYDFK